MSQDIIQINPEDTPVGRHLAALREQREAAQEGARRGVALIGGVQWCHEHAGVAYDGGQKCDLFGADLDAPCRLVDIYELPAAAPAVSPEEAPDV